MNDLNYTYGNLALSVSETRPSFEVVDGGASDVSLSSRSSACDISNRGFIQAHLGSLVFFSIIIAAAAYFGVSCAASEIALNSALQSSDRVEQVVHSGDTLWNIAESHQIKGLDVNQTVEVIRTWNNLKSSNLNIGDTLFVPGL